MEIPLSIVNANLILSPVPQGGPSLAQIHRTSTTQGHRSFNSSLNSKSSIHKLSVDIYNLDALPILTQSGGCFHIEKNHTDFSSTVQKKVPPFSMH